MFGISVYNIKEVDLSILTMAANGLEYKEISTETHFSNATVKRRLRRVKEFLGATNTTHAVAIALRRGLIK